MNAVEAAVRPGIVIEVGDLLYQDVDSAYPACSQGNRGTKAANQELLADRFLGVAMQRSGLGYSDPIRVATTGIFEFDCAGGTFELGDLMGAHQNYDGDRLLNQHVAPVAISKYAIARVARRDASQVSTILVDIRSTVMTGGVKGSSPAGV